MCDLKDSFLIKWCNRKIVFIVNFVCMDVILLEDLEGKKNWVVIGVFGSCIMCNVWIIVFGI